MRSIFFFTVIFLFGITSSWAQSPVADYQLPASVCLEEKAYLENQSTNASYFEWDFCPIDLDTASLTISEFKSTDINRAFEARPVVNGNDLFLFVPNRQSRELLRVEVGPTIQEDDVISLSLSGYSFIQQPSSVSIKQLGGKWYGALVDFQTNKLVWLTFNSNLSELVNVEEIELVSTLASPSRVELVSHNNKVFVIVGNDGNNLIQTLEVDNLEAPIVNSEQEISTGLSRVSGFDIAYIDGTWVVLALGRSDTKLVKLTFGSSLNDAPVHEDITPVGLSLSGPTGIELLRENGEFQSFITGRFGDFYRLNFGESISQTPDGFKLSSFGASSWSIDYVQWPYTDRNLFSTVFLESKIFHIGFNDECYALQSTATQENPSVSYSQPGTYPITLTAYDEEGNTSSITKEITVTSDVAPSVDFTVGESLCITSPVSFSGTSDQAITSWNWDFGDGETATGENPDHTFATAGTYEVVLSVNSAAGCSNTYRQEVTVYEEPAVTFSYDAGTGVCTNKEIDFSNTTTVPSEATFLWSFGDGTTSTAENPQHLYEEVGDYEVELMIEFAGCSSTIQETLTVNPGPAVDFEASNICLGEATSFTNLSTGEFLTGYQWDFGDGFTASVDNPEHSFEESGTKIVMLTAETSNGCDVSISKAIEIGDLATVDFSYGLACAANTILFEDNSSVQNTNIIAYHWDFGIANATNDTASTANPEFTYTEPGVYQVMLEVETLQGCISSLTQEIEVLSSPQASIQYDAICLGEEVVFQPATTTNIINYFWELQNEEGQVLTTSLSTNFTYSFSETGRYQLRHRIQQNNLCSREVVEQIEIKALPAPDFSVNTICAGDAYLFQNNTVLNENSNVTYEWFVEGELFSTQETPERIFEEPGSYTISLNAIADGACVATANKTLAVIANPSPQFSLLQNIGASPFTIEVDNESVAGMEYTWLLNQEEIGNTRDLDYTIEETGTYLLGLKITNENGCADSIYKQIEVLEPSLDVSIVNLRLNEEEGQTQFIITVHNNGSIRVDEIQMRLDFGTFEVSENTSESFQPFSTKNVVLSTQVSTSQLSRIDAICLEASIIGEFDLSDSNATDNTICINLTETYKVMEPYPNPSSGDITIPFIVPNAGELNVFLQQTDGKVVRATNYSAKAGYNKLSVSKQNVSAGIYLLRIIYQGEERIKRVVFQ